MPNEVKFGTSSMTWIQLSLNKQGEIKGQREVNLPLLDSSDAVDAAVESFAEFVAEQGGDINSSVLATIDDLQQVARNSIARVDKSATEAEIKLAGAQLKSVIQLYKTLESYYVAKYEYPRTGTDGD